MNNKCIVVFLLALSAGSAGFAQVTAPTSKINPFRRKVALIAGFSEGSEKSETVKKFAASFMDSHAAAFAFASKTRPGADRFRVLDASGAVVYEGGDDREAEAAVVNALTDMPVPGQLINGVVLKKFKNLQKSLVMGRKAEGAALAPIRAALKSRKPAEAKEAQAVLDSIEKAKKSLEEAIADDLADEDKGAALRDIRWFCLSWPSERDRYAADFKRLSADPDAKAGEAKLLKAMKRRK